MTRVKLAGILSALLMPALAVQGLASPGEFSLSRYTTPLGRIIDAARPVETREANEHPPGTDGTKRPWIAALRVFSLNVEVWLVDRYVRNVDYSYISWAAIKENFRHGFFWDNDLFATSFVGHPYHGSQYFNAARSEGLNFWESIPYCVGGYLNWGFFFENDWPSYNDLIFTTLGGINLGEFEHRLSSQILDDSATGAGRVGREILAALINPARGMHRLFNGDMSRVRAVNQQQREPLHGNLTLSGMLVSNSSSLSRLHFSPGLTWDMVYGLDSSGIAAGHPFDLMVFNGEALYAHARSRGYVTLSTYGSWYAKEWDGGSGRYYALGLFQHYDFLNNEALEMGGTSTTLGFLSLVPLGRGLELKSSIQAGGLLIGGIKNPYLRLGDRDYSYGLGFAGKLDAWLSHPALGMISLHFSHFRSGSIAAAPGAEADRSRDVLTLFSVQYSLPFSAGWGVCLDYDRFALRQHFEGHPHNIRNSSRVGAAVEFHF